MLTCHLPQVPFRCRAVATAEITLCGSERVIPGHEYSLLYRVEISGQGRHVRLPGSELPWATPQQFFTCYQIHERDFASEFSLLETRCHISYLKESWKGSNCSLISTSSWPCQAHRFAIEIRRLGFYLGCFPHADRASEVGPEWLFLQ